jgi:predicted molibdopterin-dependent oxidoreductase YjgC
MAKPSTIPALSRAACNPYPEATGDKVIGTYSSAPHPLHHGGLCIRGRHVHAVASPADRVTHLLIKEHDAFQPESRSEAYDSLKKAATYLTTVSVFFPSICTVWSKRSLPLTRR